MSFKKRNCPIPPCPKGSSEQGILGRYYEFILEITINQQHRYD